ncbi:MAG: hypothetical protein WBC51_21120 [Vicinamibacterales bacterium]|jgi:hypothetical protein
MGAWVSLTESVDADTMVRSTSAGGTVLFDPDFLGSGYCRKVYVVGGGTNRPWRTEAHAHSAPQVCSLLVGEATLFYERPDSSIASLPIEPGRYYRIGPNVPHQFEVRGPAVFESFDSADTLLRWMAADRKSPAKRVLRPDLFTRWSREAALPPT